MKRTSEHKAENKDEPGIIHPSDLSELQSVHQFVRDEQYDERNKGDWKIRMARRYYEKLYKEYAIVDLSRYKERKFGLRWRTEDEVVSGKGQSICGGKKCTEIEGLASYEMPFTYLENNEKKCELVKVRVCKSCAKKLRKADISSTDGSKK
eukprot:CAMPEP_0201114764 /NCGR_PEP_ID=MMETSP0812-20130820/78574_1 /ASSEMBLY_ACC=CAM_ASM_000668 /TAXON_ID=98059 /ORGANISM="Dinobryon sp., Strain UTEXLB2267" /LENGTH=150 /DNA_ID=CAMNT_0047378431 /DNA_START=1636 /DNA_END=2085 /DNA_ORIENTATION=-